MVTGCCVCCWSGCAADCSLFLLLLRRRLRQLLVQHAPTLANAAGRCSAGMNAMLNEACQQGHSRVPTAQRRARAPLVSVSSSSRCRSNQNATAFSTPSATTSSLSTPSLRAWAGLGRGGNIGQRKQNGRGGTASPPVRSAPRNSPALPGTLLAVKCHIHHSHGARQAPVRQRIQFQALVLRVPPGRGGEARTASADAAGASRAALGLVIPPSSRPPHRYLFISAQSSPPTSPVSTSTPMQYRVARAGTTVASGCTTRRRASSSR